ncbi:MAG: exodeoxyribonuclease III [Mesorhizobium sp.]|nr:MAG: exodeoxyribonuclease III [Mesorhizobium sp.]
MKIASFNINNINSRLDNLLAWLASAKPDVVCLQELKARDTQFPLTSLANAGYGAVWKGEPTWNGVAILARGAEPVLTRDALPGDDADRQSRYIEAAVNGIVIACLYAPNGNPQPGPKFQYKLAWHARLEAHAAQLFDTGLPVVLAGDYNVIPEPTDARFPENWLGDALFQPQTRQAFRRLLNLGFTEAVRAVTDAPDTYTFWDYQAGAWQKNNGIRIDHLLLSPEAANRFSSASIEKHVRAWEKPSDHVPVAIDLALQPA